MTSPGLEKAGKCSPRLDNQVPATTLAGEEGTDRLWWTAAAQGVDKIMHIFPDTGSTQILAVSLLVTLSCSGT